MSKIEEPTETPMSKSANRAREVKELTTKLRHLSPLAKAEVMNDAFEKTVSKQFMGFTDFLREQSVVGLAVGLVLGTQIKQFVDSIVANFINPFLGLLLPGKGTLAEKTFTLHLYGKAENFGWGAVANTLLSFISVAILVYVTFKTLKLEKLTKKKDEVKGSNPKPEKAKKITR